MPGQHAKRLSDFTEQLKEFREEDEARWKYQEKEFQRQLRIRQAEGNSNQRFMEELKKAGINVKALESDAQEALKQQQAALPS
jgi:hypothetical protein